MLGPEWWPQSYFWQTSAINSPQLHLGTEYACRPALGQLRLVGHFVYFLLKVCSIVLSTLRSCSFRSARNKSTLGAQELQVADQPRSPFPSRCALYRGPQVWIQYSVTTPNRSNIHCDWVYSLLLVWLSNRIGCDFLNNIAYDHRLTVYLIQDTAFESLSGLSAYFFSGSPLSITSFVTSSSSLWIFGEGFKFIVTPFS